jgi:acetylornithine deacetylase/succinyl-diaminopimelate desuccinylase-like protein
MRSYLRNLCLLTALGLTASLTAAAQSPARASEPSNVLARDLLEELVEINTTDTPAGNVTTAAEAMAARLRSAGFGPGELQVLGPNDRKKNLVVRLKGTGAHRPLLWIGHLDVVQALRTDWSTDPFKLVEKDGYFYGRGTLDMKSGDAIMVATLIRLKREGFRPNRDLIVALTADEETGSANGVEWLTKNHRELVDAELAISGDDESVLSVHGRPEYYSVIANEKVYGDFLLTTTSSGGHSSLPVPQNAIYELTDGLARIEHYVFPVELDGVTRSYYERMSQVESGQRAADMRAITQRPPDEAAVARLARDPLDNAMMHTTCVATRLNAGHANNALPQTAQANVNCRILPGHSLEEVRQTLIRLLADPKIRVQYVADDGHVFDQAPARSGMPPLPVSPEIMGPLEKLVAEMWPGIPVVPSLAVGASDAVFTRGAGIPTYTLTGLQMDRDDDRAHGKDERLGVGSFYRGNEFMYRYLKAIAGS